MSLANQGNWAARKRFATIDGTRVAYVEVEGDGPALLLIHGFTDSSRSFSLLAPHLAGRRLVMPDLRGHGASAGAERFGLADFAGDVAGLIGALDLEGPVLVGHSLGAMIAVETAARSPVLCNGIVLLAGTLKADISNSDPISLGVKALRDPISPHDPFFAAWHDCLPSVPQPFLATLAQEASRIPAARWRTILDVIRHADLSENARRIADGTALVISGGRDPLFGESHTQALVQALAGAATLRLEGCGHNLHWEEPALVASAIAARFPARTLAPASA